MLSADDIRELAKMRRLRPHQEEKRYVLCAILSALCREFPDALAFKGGTSLFLLHGLDRFSEDLDFSAKGEIDAGKVAAAIKNALSFLGISAVVTDRHSRQGIAINSNAQGPLFSGAVSFCSVKVEISARGDLEKETKSILFSPQYRDLVDTEVPAMDLHEVAAEKIRAIITRNMARDAYDLAFLLRGCRKIKCNVI